MSSVDIAQMSGKRHDNVMRDIKTMFININKERKKIGEPLINALDYEHVYLDAKNEQRPCYHLTRDLWLAN